MKKFVSLLVCLTLLLGGLNFALAQEEDLDYEFNYSYDYGNTTPITNEEAEALAAGLFGLGIVGIVIAVIGLLIGLFFLIFWIIMLIDCFRRDFDNKGIWLAALIITFFIGWSWLAAILYYFLVKRKNLGSIGGSKPDVSESSDPKPPEPPKLPEPPKPPEPPVE